MPEGIIVPRSTSLAYGLGHVFNDLCASMWFTYFLIFYTSVLQFSNRLSGAALAIGQVADGIATQIVGVLSDKSTGHCLCSYGRRKTWHLLGTIGVFFSFPFVFSPLIASRNSNINAFIYYCILIVIFQFGWAAVQISHLSLVPDLTFHVNERTRLYAIRYGFTILSNFIVYIIMLYLVRNEEQDGKQFDQNDGFKFQLIACMVTAIGSVTSFLFHIGVKEIRHTTDSDRAALVSFPNNRVSLFFDLKFYNVTLIYVSVRLFFNMNQIYLPYYMHKYLQLCPRSLAILPLTMFISSFITSAIISQFYTAFGCKKTFVIGAAVGIMACHWVYFGRVDDMYFKKIEIYGVVIAFGCANTVLLVTSLGICSDLIGDNVHQGSFIYGFMSLLDKVSNGVAVLIIENLESVFRCPNYYKYVLIMCCSAAVVFGTLLVLFLKSNNHREQIIEPENRDA